MNQNNYIMSLRNIVTNKVNHVVNECTDRYNLIDYTNNIYIHMNVDEWTMKHPSTGKIETVEMIIINNDCSFGIEKLRLDEILKQLKYGNYTFTLYRLASFGRDAEICFKSGEIITFDPVHQCWEVL